MLTKNFIILIIVILSVNLVFAQTSKWRVIWDPNPASDSVAYYEIYIGSDSNNVNLVSTVNHPNTEYRDSLGIGGLGLNQGQIYYYRIKAVNQHGSSLFSNAAYASIPEITFTQLSLPISTDTTFSLNQPQFVNDPDFEISQLAWDVQDLVPGDSIQHLLINSNTINFITPTDSTIQDLLQFRVFDVDSFFDERSVTISLIGVIIPINLPPVVSNIPNQTIIKGESFTSFDLDNYVSDADNDTSELTWIASGENNLTLNINASSHIVTITVNDTNWAGSETITFRATDPGGLFDEDVAIFAINLPGNNDPELGEINDTTIVVGKLYIHKIKATDVDNDSLYFLFIGNYPTFLTINQIDKNSANIIGTPTDQDTGSYNIEVGVFDGNGGSDSQMYTLIVVESSIELTTEIKAYPVPWVASESLVKYITFENLPSSSQLVLYNLLGEPVFSTKVDSQPFLWNIKNNSGLNVQSGLYFYYVKEGSKAISSGKIVIIR